jgi:hypothetical protein
MRKSYLFTVLLMLFFLGTLVMTNNAWAPPMGDCQDYWCTYIDICGGEVVDIDDECATLCTDGFQGNIGGGWYGCDLMAINTKNLLGEGGSSVGDAACSVNLLGKSMTLELALTDYNCITRYKCVPCDGCCPF